MHQVITRSEGPAPVIVQVQPGGHPGGAAPLTAQDVRAMRARISDLKDELQNAASRRSTVAGHLKDADPGARPGYLARLEALDTRIMGIEAEITSLVTRIGTAPTSAMVGRSPQADPELIAARVVDDIVPIVAILSVFVLAPIAIAFSRFIWRHAVAPPRPQIDQVTHQRLEQLQQAVDTIAIEVERISEGQRFVTRMLADRSAGTDESDPPRVPRESTAKRG